MSTGDYPLGGNCSCSDPECGRYGCKARRPPAMYAMPAKPFSLDPDRDARAMEALAAAINRLVDHFEASAKAGTPDRRRNPGMNENPFERTTP